MALTPENELEEALLAASRDQGRYEAFLASLTAGEILIPQPQDAPDPAAGEVTLPLIQHEGRTYVPVFTSEAQFRRGAPEGMGFIRQPLRAVVGQWPEDHGMAINPGGDLGLALAPETVRSLGGGEAPRLQRMDPDASVMLGLPSEEPTELLEALGAACRAEPGVVAAFRALMSTGEEEPQIIIGLELDDPSRAEEVFERLGAAGTTAVRGSLSFVVIDEAQLNPVARFLLLETDPFYRRAGSS